MTDKTECMLAGFSAPADRALALSPACPVPRTSGVYVWYFRAIPATVPIADCVERYGGQLLYAGISPSSNRNPRTRQTLQARIRNHFMGDSSRSTLRRTLAVLLESASGHALRRVGPGGRYEVLVIRRVEVSNE